MDVSKIISAAQQVSDEQEPPIGSLMAVGQDVVGAAFARFALILSHEAEAQKAKELVSHDDSPTLGGVGFRPMSSGDIEQMQRRHAKTLMLEAAGMINTLTQRATPTLSLSEHRQALAISRLLTEAVASDG